MNRRRHADLARALIERCGGLAEAARINGFPYQGIAHLARFQNPSEVTSDGKPAPYMPAHVINLLEQYCGEPIYSRALFDESRSSACGELKDDVCQAVLDVAELLSGVRSLVSGRPLTPNERSALHRFVAIAKEHLEQVDRDIDADVVTPIRGRGA